MKTKDTNRFFNAARTGKTLTLSMYDTIGGDLFDEGITPGMVQDALAQSEYTDVTVRLNSPGGSAFDGVAIYNVLRASGKPINVIVDGMAASAASIVMMAGDTRTVNTGAMVMIHEAMALAMGNSGDMLKMADTLTAVTGSIADIYVERTGLPKDEVLAMQAVETWMSADEAVTKGFATAVNKDKSAVKNSYNLSHFRNAPADLKEPTPEPVVETVVEPAPAFDALKMQALQLEINKRK
jgi:ATP-dependent protease ClpP protease subunit